MEALWRINGNSLEDKLRFFFPPPEYFSLEDKWGCSGCSSAYPDISKQDGNLLPFLTYLIWWICIMQEFLQGIFQGISTIEELQLLFMSCQCSFLPVILLSHCYKDIFIITTHLFWSFTPLVFQGFSF